MFKYILLLSLLSLLSPSCRALDNGLALTPPMGWLAWERFRCNTDCAGDPDNCISESLFKEMADIMATEGYLEAGYDIVSLDDCWLNHTRDADGKLSPDPHRFPSGVKALADYIHDKGIKFGIYEDYGNFTCAGYPGVLGHLETDANTFAEWGVDYVKLDGCYSKPATMDKGYPEFGHYLNQTKRPMVYSCSWPDYQRLSSMTIDWDSIIGTCNLWRNYNDIQDSWDSVLNIIDYFGDNQDMLVPLAGPGHWNDPDMLLIGNYGLSLDQSKAQMGMWAILAAPLLMSTDLRHIRQEHKDILLNRRVIMVNQDSLGIQGKRVKRVSHVDIWVRPVRPIIDGQGSYAILLLNRGLNTPSKVQLSLDALGFEADAYHVIELFDGNDWGNITSNKILTVSVNPTGVVMLRCEPVPKS